MSRRLPHVVAIFVALALAGSDAVRLEARPPVTRAEVEGNDTAASATPLALFGRYGIATGALAPGDVDYWSFTGPSFAHVSILCDTGGEQITGATSRRVIVDLIDPQGGTVERDSGDGTGNGGDSSIETPDAAAIAYRVLPTGGRFYIRVAGAAPSDVVAPYRLFVAVTPMPLESEREPNYAAFLANEIARFEPFGSRTGAIGTPGDEDYFSVFASAGDVLFFALDSRSDGGSDLAVDLVGLSDVALLSVDSAQAGSVSDPPGESATFTIPATAVYYIRVRHASGGTGSYTLMAVVQPFGDAPADLDGDGRTDLAVYSSQGLWSTFRSTDFQTSNVSWGEPLRDDIPVPADYDGDGVANTAVYRNTTGQWIVQTADGAVVIDWGAPWLGDMPAPGDYDGDHRYDAAVYRASTGDWFIRFAAGGSAWYRWGVPWLEDTPVPADYDGDGVTDVAVYRGATGEWFLRHSSTGRPVVWNWGAPWLDDVPVPGDYDGNGRAEVAVYRRSEGAWFVRPFGWYRWGAAGSDDIPVPGDYDGDGTTDVAVYRQSTGVFYVRTSYSSGAFTKSMNGPDHVPVNRPVAVR